MATLTMNTNCMRFGQCRARCENDLRVGYEPSRLANEMVNVSNGDLETHASWSVAPCSVPRGAKRRRAPAHPDKERRPASQQPTSLKFYLAEGAWKDSLHPANPWTRYRIDSRVERAVKPLNWAGVKYTTSSTIDDFAQALERSEERDESDGIVIADGREGCAFAQLR